MMNFKHEIVLLLAAIGFFVVSAFLYSYPTYQEGFANLGFDYQGYAFSFVGFGTLLMVAASISFMRRNKTLTVGSR